MEFPEHDLVYSCHEGKEQMGIDNPGKQHTQGHPLNRWASPFPPSSPNWCQNILHRSAHRGLSHKVCFAVELFTEAQLGFVVNSLNFTVVLLNLQLFRQFFFLFVCQDIIRTEYLRLCFQNYLTDMKMFCRSATERTLPSRWNVISLQSEGVRGIHLSCNQSQQHCA